MTIFLMAVFDFVTFYPVYLNNLFTSDTLSNFINGTPSKDVIHATVASSKSSTFFQKKLIIFGFLLWPTNSTLILWTSKNIFSKTSFKEIYFMFQFKIALETCYYAIRRFNLLNLVNVKITIFRVVKIVPWWNFVNWNFINARLNGY